MGEPRNEEKDRAVDGAARNDTAIHAEQLVDDLEARVLDERPDTSRQTQEEGDSPAFEQDLDEQPADRGPGAEPS